MASFDSYSPVIWLSLLGGLSLASILVTFNGQDLPGALSNERITPHEEEVRSFQQSLGEAFSRLPSLSGLCEDPVKALQTLDFGSQREIIFQDPRWISERNYFPQGERDAWARCQNQSLGHTRQRRCFHFVSQITSERPWDSPINIVELSFEWYGSDRKKPVDCTAALAKGELQELAIYYSFYWSDGKSPKGREKWTFKRMTGGLRLDPHAKVAL